MNASSPLLQVRGVSKTLGGRAILHDVSITVDPGDLKVLIGPSGAGKSTFLQCINRLIAPDEGEILLNGMPIDGSSTAELCRLRQEVGMIFQDFNLFDHLTAEANVALALRKVRGLSSDNAGKRARKELERVGLASRAGLYPAQLSGGQKQRVAIARALAMEPKVLLMDEPFGALDALTRAHLQDELLRIVGQTQSTVVMVTHDVDEAVLLSDRIVMMTNGPAATVGEILAVELPRPRDRLALANDPQYHAYRTAVLEFLYQRQQRPAA